MDEKVETKRHPGAAGGRSAPDRWLHRRELRDTVVVAAAALGALIVSSALDLAEIWHDLVLRYEDTIELDEWPIVFMIAGFGFAWFAWRRWRDFAYEAARRAETNAHLETLIAKNNEMIGKLEIARAAAEDSDRAKSRFLAHMSHELRTPLNAIIGFADLIEAEAYGPIGQEKYAGYISDIAMSGRHLLALINDVLDISRLQAGHLVPEDGTVNLGEVAAMAASMLKEEAAAKRIGLSTQCRAGSTPPVRADGRMLSQVIINLVANAIRHTPAGGRVDIGCRTAATGGVAIRIADTGEGMSESVIRRAMGGFGEVAHAQNKTHNGAGIGLPLSRAIMEAHGGTLEIESREGQGTEITCTLPPERVGEAARNPRPAMGAC